MFPSEALHNSFLQEKKPCFILGFAQFIGQEKILRKCMFLTPTLHRSVFLVVGCNGAFLQVPMMTLLVGYTDE